MKKNCNNLILFLLTFLLISCNRKEAHLSRTTISFLLDATDTNRVIPTPNSLLSLYHFNENICRAVTYRQSYITDYSTNDEVELSIGNRIDEEKAGNLMDDPNYRKKQIINFKSDVANSIAMLNLSKYSNRPETKCFEAVCKELEYLVEADGKRKILIISSDLIENSELLRGYHDNIYDAALEDEKKVEEKIVELFDDEDLLPSQLSSVIVYLLFKPQTKKEDMLFKVFSTVYRTLLEKRGSIVYTKSSDQLKDYCHE